MLQEAFLVIPDHNSRLLTFW